MDPRFTYDPRAGRYRSLTSGRFVTLDTIHGWLVETTANAGRSVRDLTQQLRAGEVTLREWQLAMTDQIRLSQIASAAAAKGGLAQLTTADYQRVEQAIADNLRYLDRFARGLADGSIPLDGRILPRAEQYLLSARTTYADMQRREMVKRGLTEERRVLAPVEHCEDCVDYAAQSWQPIGSLPAPGVGSRCMTRCQCSMQYR